MRWARDQLVGAMMGVVGLVFGILSVIALAAAAVLPPILGLLALMLAPLRALIERFQRPGGAP